MTAPPNAFPPFSAALPSVPPLPDFNGIGRTDLRARAAYSEGAGIYRIVPAGVVIPSTTPALRELVSWAGQHRVPLVPRGAGSGMPGGNVGAGIVVDLTVLDGCPLTVHPEAQRAYSGTGVTLRDLQVEAGRFGLRLPPDPSSAHFATVGGMASTNAAGPASVRSGSVRRWIEALDVITVDGDALTLRRGVAPRPVAAVLRFAVEVEPRLLEERERIRGRFPRTRKNASGYALDAWLDSGDLLDLFVGAEGTLGLITGIEWRLAPSPPSYGGLRVALRNLDALGNVLARLLFLEPSALEYLDATFLRLVGESSSGEGFLMIEFEGDGEAAISPRVEEASRIVEPLAGDVRRATDRRELERLWDMRHAASPLLAGMGAEHRSLQVIEDACVPVEAAGRYITAVREAGVRHGLDLVIFGHVGDGNVHVNLLPNISRPNWEGNVAAIFEEVSAVVAELGGTLSGEHGDGRLRSRAVERTYGAEIMELFRALKRAFDPDGILNPGVKLPTDDRGGIGALKVGANAAGIPEDIEAGLREIERNAGYSVSRLELADDGYSVTGHHKRGVP